MSRAKVICPYCESDDVIAISSGPNANEDEFECCECNNLFYRATRSRCRQSYESDTLKPLDFGNLTFNSEYEEEWS